MVDARRLFDIGAGGAQFLAEFRMPEEMGLWPFDLFRTSVDIVSFPNPS